MAPENRDGIQADGKMKGLSVRVKEGRLDAGRMYVLLGAILAAICVIGYFLLPVANRVLDAPIPSLVRAKAAAQLSEPEGVCGAFLFLFPTTIGGLLIPLPLIFAPRPYRYFAIVFLLPAPGCLAKVSSSGGDDHGFAAGTYGVAVGFGQAAGVGLFGLLYGFRGTLVCFAIMIVLAIGAVALKDRV